MSTELEAFVRRLFEEFCNGRQAEVADEIEGAAISIFRIAGGRIAAEWTVRDAVGLVQQVGAVPAPA